MSLQVDSMLIELQQECLRDPDDHFGGLRAALSQLAKDQKESMREILRICHNMKGNLQAVSFTHAGHYVHELETKLDNVEKLIGQVEVPDEEVRVLEFFISDAIQSLESYFADLRADPHDHENMFTKRSATLEMLTSWLVSARRQILGDSTETGKLSLEDTSASSDLTDLNSDDEDAMSDEDSSEGQVHSLPKSSLEAVAQDVLPNPALDSASASGSASEFIPPKATIDVEYLNQLGAEQASIQLLKNIPDDFLPLDDEIKPKQTVPSPAASESSQVESSVSASSGNNNVDVPATIAPSVQFTESDEKSATGAQITEPQERSNEEILADPAQEDELMKEGLHSFLLCQHGHRYYGIPVLQILEVIKSVPLNTLPFPRSDIRGILNFRGDPLPILDSQILAEKNEHPEGRYIVIATVNNKVFGFQVESVRSVVALNERDFQRPDMVSLESNGSWATHITRFENDTILILNLEKAVAA